MVREMRKGSAGLTRVDVVFLAVSAVIILSMLASFFWLLGTAREIPARKICKDNLRQIGRAIASYRQDNGGHFPFSWMPATAEAPLKKDAMTSIACLYPAYVDDSQLFCCPSTEDRPAFVFNVSSHIIDRDGDGQVTVSDLLPGQSSLWKQRNHTLRNSSYGYDSRVSPRAPRKHAILADMDGTWMASRDTMTQNHAGWHNVLYVNGSVKWCDFNFYSDDPQDNIFCENPWHADTDSFISDNTPVGPDEDPTAFHDLSVSYDPYPDLHP